jgi:hypothetical protein
MLDSLTPLPHLLRILMSVMPDHSFGRCDGHHKKVDCTPDFAACVMSFTYRCGGLRVI